MMRLNSMYRAVAANKALSVGWGLAAMLALLLIAQWTSLNLQRSQLATHVAASALSQNYSAQETKPLLPPPPAPYAAEARTLAVASGGSGDADEQPGQEAGNEPLIARTASLSIVAKDFGAVEAAVKSITARYHGYIGELSSSSPQNAARTLTATLLIPSSQLEAALAELKQLGRAEQVSQSGEDVTKQYVDLAARLKNSRSTEERLLNVLRNNTGKVKDILETEKEIARVRGEIEQMEADQRALRTRIDFASLQLSLTEDFKASLQVTPPSTATRLHNAVVAGYRSLIESVIGFFIWLFESGPTLLLWAAILFVPARWIWKRWLRAKWLRVRSGGAT